MRAGDALRRCCARLSKYASLVLTNWSGVVGLAAGDHWHAPHAKLVAVRGRRTMPG